MPKAIAPVLLCGLFFFISGCSQNQLFQHRIYTFGTQVDISIWHDNPDTVKQALKRLDEDFQRLHAAWHPWEPGAIKRLNQLLPTGGWFTAATSVLPLLQESVRLSLLSKEYFNPAIGKLVDLWGFHRQNPKQPFQPDINLINKVQNNIPSMQDIEFDGIRIRGHNPYLQFDPGGIAKGFALELSVQTLNTYAIKNAMINAGGDIKVIGKKGESQWHIGIQHPRSERALASIQLNENESIFTSGDYQRFYMQNGKRRHHIINPFTGEPTAQTIASTVLHDNAAAADAAATALMVAGKQNWLEVISAMDISEAMLLTSDGELHLTQALKNRLKLLHTDKIEIITH